LRYADWTAQLNYVLYPHAPWPGPRLALNSSLREKQLIPTRVTLKADVGRGVQLQAEHRIDLQLEPRHLEMIHQWKTLLEGKELKWISFPAFQDSIQSEMTRTAKK